MSSSLDSLIQLGHDMYVLSHVYMCLLSFVKSEARLSISQKVLALRLRRTSRTNHGLPSQCHLLAACVILFYDYFLTLGDEVRRDHSPNTM